MLVLKTSFHLRKRIFHTVFIITFSTLILVAASLAHSTNSYASQLSLTWNANTEPNIAGYKLYYGYSSKNYSVSIDTGKNTTFVLSNFPVKKTYFAVTAYTAAGIESNFSAEVVYSPATTTTTTITPASTTVNPTTTTTINPTTTTTINPTTTTTINP
ncbi:MAG: fibronectin type III domain-containing protein, partial [Pseudomonadota bacterium]